MKKKRKELKELENSANEALAEFWANAKKLSELSPDTYAEMKRTYPYSIMFEIEKVKQ